MHFEKLIMRRNAAEAAGSDLMVFDWDKARSIINEHPDHTYYAGLKHDMEWTADVIWEHGAPKEDTTAYLASLHCTPILVDITIDVEHSCFRMQKDLIKEGKNWGADTQWKDVFGNV